APRSKSLPVGGERHRTKTRLMSLERSPRAPCGDVPQLDRSVATPSSQSRTKGRECQGGETTIVPGESGDLLPRGEVPQSGRSVGARRSQGLAVGRERYRKDPSLVADQGEESVVPAKPPQVAPLEAAQVRLAGLWDLLLQQLYRAPEVRDFGRLLGQVHVRHIKVAASGQLPLLCQEPLPLFFPGQNAEATHL